MVNVRRTWCRGCVAVGSFLVALSAFSLIDMSLRAASAVEPGPARSTRKEMVVTEYDRDFWSFQSLKRVAPPRVEGPENVRTPVDRFILAKLEAEGLTGLFVAVRVFHTLRHATYPIPRRKPT